VSGESDHPCDRALQMFLPLNVVQWNSTNVTAPHPRIRGIPLGIGRSSDPVTASEQDLLDAFRPAGEREFRLHVNFRTETNPTLRQPVFEFFQNRAGCDWVAFERPGATGHPGAGIERMRAHRFVLCPPGNGVDTHRFWETLVTGGIPVAMRSATTTPFSHLPVVLVDDLREVTKSLLEAEWERLAPAWRVPDEILEDFWRGQFEGAREALKRRTKISMSEYLKESLTYAAGMLRRGLPRPGLAASHHL